jgi:hypothetical protein
MVIVIGSENNKVNVGDESGGQKELPDQWFA